MSHAEDERPQGATTTKTSQAGADARAAEYAGAQHRAVLDALDEGFCIVEVRFEAGRPVDYRFLEVNSMFEEQTGLRNATGRWMRELAPGHEEHWFDIYGKVALTGESMRFENEAKALGSRWFDVYALRVGDPAARRVAILFRDITERKRAEQALRSSQAQLQTLF